MNLFLDSPFCFPFPVTHCCNYCGSIPLTVLFLGHSWAAYLYMILESAYEVI